MTKIKLCGLRSEKDINIANELMPDYIGFVFAPSKRQISLSTALHLKSLLNKDISAVGVFVNEPYENVIKIANSGAIDIIQLHGDEDNDYIKHIRQADKKIIKAVRIKNADDIKKASMLSCDYILADSFSESGYGGTGESFDEKLISRTEKPLFLAGGLNAENVLSKIKAVKPFAVDVSSSIEKDGYKSFSLAREFIEVVRGEF